MPNKSKVVPIATPRVPTRPRVLAGHGVLRNQIIVSIGPVVLAVDYAVRITELNGVGAVRARCRMAQHRKQPECPAQLKRVLVQRVRMSN